MLSCRKHWYNHSGQGTKGKDNRSLFDKSAKKKKKDALWIICWFFCLYPYEILALVSEKQKLRMELCEHHLVSVPITSPRSPLLICHMNPPSFRSWNNPNQDRRVQRPTCQKLNRIPQSDGVKFRERKKKQKETQVEAKWVEISRIKTIATQFPLGNNGLWVSCAQKTNYSSSFSPFIHRNLLKCLFPIIPLGSLKDYINKAI